MNNKNNYAELERELEQIKPGSAPYVERNRGYITASKLKCFENDPYTYKLKYVDEIPEPYAKEKDYFIVGQAFDDLLTEGKKWFDKNYEVVARRSSKAELTQLTNGQGELITAMQSEFKAQSLYNQTPKKKVFIIDYKGYKVKVELDNYVEDTREIRDIKTCANVNRVDLDMYLLQATLYDMVAEMRTDEKHKVYFEFVDKQLPSRSMPIHFHPDTLRGNRAHVWRLLDDLIEAHEIDLFIPTSDQAKMYESPYYGYNGYGRPTQYLIY